jgi:DNA-binding XRE family transcriptional regulator
MKINRSLLKPHSQVMAEALKDPEFKEVWEAEATQREIASKIIGERIKKKMSQRELAEKAGIKQPSLARLESSLAQNSSYQPSLALVAKIAKALGLKMEIKFSPI